MDKRKTEKNSVYSIYGVHNQITIPSYRSSLIQTLLSVLEFHQISRICSMPNMVLLSAGRGLYRRLGLSPDPEDLFLLQRLL